jgi:GNAT superfamily N-acetyltransferase
MRVDLSLEKLCTNDLDDLVTLSERIQWDYSRAEVRNFFAVGTVYGHRCHDGHLVSCAGVFPYGSDLASIGIVIVSPEFQGQGLGKALVSHCLSQTNRTPTTLISTAEGLRLYQSLGFETVAYLHKLSSDTPVTIRFEKPRAVDIHPMSRVDLEDVAALDRKVIGADRSRFLFNRLEIAYSGTTLRDGNGTLQGFGLAILRHHLLILGPIVAIDEVSALAIVSQLTTGWAGAVRVDVPDCQKGFYSCLLRAGMREEDTPPIMLLNASQLPGQRQLLHAIAAQAFG